MAALDAALRASGADRVRITPTFVTRPPHDQYRDKVGNLVDNQRADKIDRYEVTAALEVEVRDAARRARAAAEASGIRRPRAALTVRRGRRPRDGVGARRESG